MATWQEETPAGIVLARTTTRDEGDFAVDGEPRALAERRRRVVDLPWIWLRQVHGARVVVATHENAAALAGTEADAVVTTEADLVLAVQTADCVPLVFWSDNGVVGVAHAGWRGFEAGVVARTVGTMRALGAEGIRGRSGPHIEGACYEFGAADLDRLAERFGDRVRTTTREGRPALDLAELAGASTDDLALAGWTPAGSCTACEAGRWFSHRARADAGRMATVVWRASAGATGGVVIDAAVVGEHLAAVRARIAAAGGGAAVDVLAVTKAFGPDAVVAARAAGLDAMGENYAQELLDKARLLGPDAQPQWHFIGRLQRNKVRQLAPHVALWQTVDRPELAAEIARRAPAAAVLVQLNLSGEDQKGGCAPDDAPSLVAAATAAGLDVRGLMGVGPAGPPEAARPGFRQLVALADRLGLPIRSIGMSADLEIAVQEGSTMVRIGRDLFGERPPRSSA